MCCKGFFGVNLWKKRGLAEAGDGEESEEKLKSYGLGMNFLRIFLLGCLFTFPIHILSFFYFQTLHHLISARKQEISQITEVNRYKQAEDTVAGNDDKKRQLNLVIGLASGKDSLNGLFRFCKSFRNSNKKDELAIVIPKEELSHELMLLSRDFQVRLILYEREDIPPPLRNAHASSYRWPLIHDYLQRKRKCGESLIEPYNGKECQKLAEYHLVRNDNLFSPSSSSCCFLGFND